MLPEGGAVGFYSDWRNGGRGGAPAWETFHLRELRGLLERDFGAGRRRAIAGLSMGGLGAMAYAARHPGLFGAAASFSGLVHPRQHAAFLLGLMGAFTPDARAVWGDPARDRATWAAHDPTRSPRACAAPGSSWPPATGARARSTAAGAPATASRRRSGPRRGPSSRRLRALRVRARTDLYGPGTHTWPYWQRELHRALPTLLGAARLAAAPLGAEDARGQVAGVLRVVQPDAGDGHAGRHLGDAEQRVEAAHGAQPARERARRRRAARCGRRPRRAARRRARRPR